MSLLVQSSKAPNQLAIYHAVKLMCILLLTASRNHLCLLPKKHPWIGVTACSTLKKNTFWLNCTKEALNNYYETLNSISWGAYRASSESKQSHVICPISLLPLFCEPAHTLATIKNSFSVIKSAVDHLNFRQTPGIAFDQPLYALYVLAKKVKYVVMCGGLYIETAVLKHWEIS